MAESLAVCFCTPSSSDSEVSGVEGLALWVRCQGFGSLISAGLIGGHEETMASLAVVNALGVQQHEYRLLRGF